jgi:lycopene cyclase domain-containing protein
VTGAGAYALLALPFFAVVAVVAVVAGVVAGRRTRVHGRGVGAGRRTAVVTALVAGAALLVMTIVFDNVIVTLRIVAYDPSLISGAKIGAIPVEDLAYSLAAIVLLPSLWVLFDRTAPRDREDARDRTAERVRTAPRDRTAPPDRTDERHPAGARTAPDPTTDEPEPPQ